MSTAFPFLFPFSLKQDIHRHIEDLIHLVGAGSPGWLPVDDSDERHHQRGAHDRVDRCKRAENGDVRRVAAQLLTELTQCGGFKRSVVVVQDASGEGDLPGMLPHRFRPSDEDQAVTDESGKDSSQTISGRGNGRGRLLEARADDIERRQAGHLPTLAAPPRYDGGMTATTEIVPDAATNADVLAVTDAAAAKIAQLAAREERAAILRVRVLAGGCSGFTYELGFEDTPAENDFVIDAGSATVLIDPRSAPIVQGSTLEFVNTLMEGGLKVLNPQATHECACGQSFSL